jgi:hypothetical protein
MNLNNGIDPIKLVVAAFLAQHLNSVTGKLRSGAYELAMAEFPNIARSTLERYWAEYKRTGGAGMAVNNLKGRCGRKTKLTAVLREIYREICIRYSRRWIRLTVRLLQDELDRSGNHLSTSTIHNHLKIMKARKYNVRIKPLLTRAQEIARIEFILDMRDMSHGLHRPVHHFKDHHC